MSEETARRQRGPGDYTVEAQVKMEMVILCESLSGCL